jgi:hypothetical protein
VIPFEYFDKPNQLSAVGYIYVLLDYKGALDRAGAALLRTAGGTGNRLPLRFSHVAGVGAATLHAVADLTGLYSRLATEPEYRPAFNTASRDSFLWPVITRYLLRSAVWRRTDRGIHAAMGAATFPIIVVAPHQARFGVKSALEQRNATA